MIVHEVWLERFKYILTHEILQNRIVGLMGCQVGLIPSVCLGVRLGDGKVDNIIWSCHLECIQSKIAT